MNPGLGRLLRRLSPAPRPVVVPPAAAVPPPGRAATAVKDAPLRVPVTLRGTISSVTVNPRGVNRWLEAVLDDGTGEVLLVWMGRRTVRGIDPGRTLEATGTLTLLDGRRAIYNPSYSLQA